MTPIVITERYEYDYCIDRGFQSLIDTRNFSMDIKLRVAIQQELFGRGIRDTMVANERFFRWVWAHKPHICEETMRPLRHYSAVYCSHILTRGAFPEMATDPRNINLLCFEQHNRWENGDRENMRIYPGNVATIEMLKSEYQKL